MLKSLVLSAGALCTILTSATALGQLADQAGNESPSSQYRLEQNNKAVVARVINEVVNGGRFELVDELFADDLVEHDPHQAKGPTPKEAFIAAVQGLDRSFPDGKMVIDAQIAEGDLVATRWHMTGTHLGDYQGIEATGRKIHTTGIFYDRLKDGKMVETWANYDVHGLLQQLTVELPEQ